MSGVRIGWWVFEGIVASHPGDDLGGLGVVRPGLGDQLSMLGRHELVKPVVVVRLVVVGGLLFRLAARFCGPAPLAWLGGHLPAIGVSWCAGGPGVSVAGGCADAESFGFLEGAGAHDFAGAAAGLTCQLHDCGVFGGRHFDEDAGSAQIFGFFGWTTDAFCCGHGVVFGGRGERSE